MKILTIGDVHGKSTWKEATHGTLNFFEDYIKGIDFQYPYLQYDKIIFVGDYVDSWKIPNVDIIANLKDIIEFKKREPDRVVLLIGNHDVQYFVMHTTCDGYRPVMKHDLYDLFMRNIDLFKFAHSEKDSNCRIHLWTHAGITTGWYNIFQNKLFDDEYRFRKDTIGMESEEDPAVLLNFAWERRGDGRDVLFNVDDDSGGCSYWGSPLWVRPRTLNEFAVPQINQIVGHTSYHEPWRHTMNEAGDPYWIQYIDCLYHGITWEADI